MALRPYSVHNNDPLGYLPGPPRPNVTRAIEDIQVHGLAKTTLEDTETQQHCVLGALMYANPHNGVAISTLADLVGLLPPKPGDAELIHELTHAPMMFLLEVAVAQAVDRIAEFNDDPGTTAEDVLVILKRLMEDD